MKLILQLYCKQQCRGSFQLIVIAGRCLLLTCTLVWLHVGSSICSTLVSVERSWSCCLVSHGSRSQCQPSRRCWSLLFSLSAHIIVISDVVWSVGSSVGWSSVGLWVGWSSVSRWVGQSVSWWVGRRSGGGLVVGGLDGRLVGGMVDLWIGQLVSGLVGGLVLGHLVLQQNGLIWVAAWYSGWPRPLLHCLRPGRGRGQCHTVLHWGRTALDQESKSPTDRKTLVWHYIVA